MLTLAVMLGALAGNTGCVLAIAIALCAAAMLESGR